jgi:hypothetical protein
MVVACRDHYGKIDFWSTPRMANRDFSCVVLTAR